MTNAPPSPQGAAPQPAAPVRALAFYLPQYHSIEQNNAWWGTGFTEWTNVVRARSLFRGHTQPHLPTDLGLYDLRVPEARQAQADMARAAGVHGFVYYHYWFNGQRLLQQPFQDVLAAGQPDFPFCLCWANETWTRTWDGRSQEVLIEQRYSPEDDRAHMAWLARAFQDPRYIRVEGKPLFLVYRASSLPDAHQTTAAWRQAASQLGVGPLFLARVESFPTDRTDPRPLGFDAAVEFHPDWLRMPQPMRRGRLWRAMRAMRLANPAYDRHRVISYPAHVQNAQAKLAAAWRRYPCVMPGWDNSARRKDDALIFVNSTPVVYESWLRRAAAQAQTIAPDDPLVFINAWNEWGEGCHLEPDQLSGTQYLEATRRALGAPN